MSVEDTINKAVEDAITQSISPGSSSGSPAVNPAPVIKKQEVVTDISKPLAARKEHKEQRDQVLDYEKLMDIGNRLLRQKMDEHMSAISAYELQRTELADSYRIRIEHLRNEADEQLHQLEEAHNSRIQGLERLINKLRSLREA